jgi:hypothetical protein
MAKNGATPERQHPSRRLLGHQKTAKRGHRDGALNRRRIDIDHGATHPSARVEHDDIGRAKALLNRVKQRRDGRRLRGIR